MVPINPKDAIVHFARERRNFRRIARILGPVIWEQVRKERLRGVVVAGGGSSCWRPPLGPRACGSCAYDRPGQRIIGKRDKQELVTLSTPDAQRDKPLNDINSEGKEEADSKRLVWAWMGRVPDWPFAKGKK